MSRRNRNHTRARLGGPMTPLHQGAMIGPQIKASYFPGRVLVGWLSGKMDARYLCGDHRPNPSPALLSQHRWIIRAGQKAREALSYFEQGVAIQSLTVDYSAHSLALHRHPNFQSKFDQGYEVRLVDLRQICALQPVVSLPKVRDMMAQLGTADSASIAALALPLVIAQNAVMPQTGTFGVVRVLSVQASTVPLEFSYLQVAKLDQRYILTDGYHRAVAFISRGIYLVPSLYREARSIAEAGLGRPGELSLGLLSRRRPPLVTDFLLGGLAADISA
jgi:hypothetical protein